MTFLFSNIFSMKSNPTPNVQQWQRAMCEDIADEWSKGILIVSDSARNDLVNQLVKVAARHTPEPECPFEFTARRCPACETPAETRRLYLCARALLRRADERLDAYGLGSQGSPLRCDIHDLLSLPNK